MNYKRGVQSSVLPAVPADADRVPEPYLLQIVKKPKVRADRKPIVRFKLLTPINQVQFAILLTPACWLLCALFACHDLVTSDKSLVVVSF